MKEATSAQGPRECNAVLIGQALSCAHLIRCARVLPGSSWHTLASKGTWAHQGANRNEQRH